MRHVGNTTTDNFRVGLFSELLEVVCWQTCGIPAKMGRSSQAGESVVPLNWKRGLRSDALSGSLKTFFSPVYSMVHLMWFAGILLMDY